MYTVELHIIYSNNMLVSRQSSSYFNKYNLALKHVALQQLFLAWDDNTQCKFVSRLLFIALFSFCFLEALSKDLCVILEVSSFAKLEDRRYK